MVIVFLSDELNFYKPELSLFNEFWY